MMTASLPINGFPTPATVRRLRRAPLDPNALTPQLEAGVRASARAVLGAILFAYQPPLAREIYDAVRVVVGPDDFGDRRDEYLFQAIRECVADGEPIDLVGIANRARSFAGADMVFSQNSGDPSLYCHLEVHSDHLASDPGVALVHARVVARAAADYHARLAADELLLLSKTEPDAFWLQVKALYKERIESETAKAPRETGFPLVRVKDMPEPGPTTWLVDQLWTTHAFGIVGAEPKSWKSWLTLYLGICIAGGYKAFNRFEVTQGTVLVFSAEGGNGLVRRRAAALCRAMQIEIPDDLIVIDTPTLRLDDPETVTRIVATVDKVKPSLLLLDPLRELHGGDENDAATVAALLGPLRLLQAKGCACMVVHHLGKRNETRGRGAQRGGQRLRGSSALHGAVDSALYMETSGEGERKRVVVVAEHRAEAEPEPIVLRLCYRKLPELTVWLEIVDKEDEDSEKKIDEEVTKREHKRKAILNVVRSSSMPGRTPFRTATAIAKVVHGNAAFNMRVIKELVESGVIFQDATKAFRINPEEGNSDASAG